MSPVLFSDSVSVVHDFFESEQLSFESRITLLKLLKIATMIEDDNDDSLTAMSIRKYNCSTHLQKQFIVRVRCLSPIQDLSNEQERFVYVNLIKIYNIQD